MPLAGPGIKLSIRVEIPEGCFIGYAQTGGGVSKVRGGRLHCIKGEPMTKFLTQLWKDESGQDIAEYAVMLAVILVIVVGTVRLIGSNANNVFSEVGSSIAQ